MGGNFILLCFAFVDQVGKRGSRDFFGSSVMFKL